jgi:hypothetical protein
LRDLLRICNKRTNLAKAIVVAEAAKFRVCWVKIQNLFLFIYYNATESPVSKPINLLASVSLSLVNGNKKIKLIMNASDKMKPFSNHFANPVLSLWVMGTCLSVS